MAGLPIMVEMRGRRCVVVGGGAVATRRGLALAKAGAAVRVVAPVVAEELAAAASYVCRRPYEAGDVAGAFLVVAATDDDGLNAAIAADALAVGALVNRPDDPQAGDVVFPAQGSSGPVTVAVAVEGGAPSAAAAIRDECLAKLDPAWPALLAAAAPYRPRIQAAIADPVERRRRLLALVDGESRRTYAEAGLPGLLARYERLCEATAGNVSN